MLIRTKACCVIAIVAATFSQLGATSDTGKSQLKRISFRTVKPVAGHFHSEQDAASMEKTLKQLGCTIKRTSHDGHIDLTYECKYWKSLTMKEAKEVEQWNKWLTSKGFAVVHNTPSKDHKETVEYYLKEWRTYHGHKPEITEAYVEMFKMLGCEVKVAKHNGHDDIQYRCTTMQSLGVPNHSEAHAWMQIMQKLGFTTLHEH